MKRNILFFLSEILSAKTLLPILQTSLRLQEFEVKVVNDGFCVDFVRSLGVDFDLIEGNFEARIGSYVSWADIVVLGKSYVQQSEYYILEQADHERKLVLLILPDMGSDVVRAKLRGVGGTFGEGVPMPLLLLADASTRDTLVKSGVPTNKTRELGNPYFDMLYTELAADDSIVSSEAVGYFSTPFELDYTRGILPARYRQIDLISDIKQACVVSKQQLVAKRHPQLEPSLFRGIEMFEGTPLEMLRRVGVVIGSYSTTLLEAYVAGVPAISYQPWNHDIRADVFAGRIPIAKTQKALIELLEGAIKHRHERLQRGRVITFNPGRSVEQFFDIVANEMMGRGGSVR